MKKIIMFVMVLAISAPALADDLNPPDWAGGPGTIYGIWEFPSAESGQVGDYPEEGLMVPHDTHPDPEDENEPSNDTDEIAHHHQVVNWAEDVSWLASHEGREGVVEVGGLNFGMFNFPGEGSKMIRLQLTWTGSEIGIFYFDAPPLAEWDGPASEYHIETVELENGWFHSTYDFPIEVNPDWEQFWVGPPGTAYYDQIVIDTICYEGELPSGPGRGSAPKPPVTVDSSGMPVYEPADPCGPPAAGSVTGQFLVDLTWRPGEDLGYPDFTATVVIEPNGIGPHKDFVFSDAPDPNANIRLTFTEANWSVPQAVNVEALADLDREGNQKYPIELIVTIDIADPNFGSPAPVVVGSSVSVVDNDIPYISILPLGAFDDVLTENEPCVPVCVDITISHQPTDDVYVVVVRDAWDDPLLESMSVMDPPLGSTDDPNKLKFTPGNYNVVQTICLEARDDDELIDPWYEWIEGWITLTTYSEDERYRVSWLNPDGSDAPPIIDPCDPCNPGDPDSGGEAEETEIDFTVQDNECGSVGYPPYDKNENCYVDLSDVAILYSQWFLCTDPYDAGYNQWADCDRSWNLVE